jgi:phosphotransferase system enzyme I (PtsI)
LNAQRPEIVLRGTGVSPGIALGHALKVDSHNRMILKLYIDEHHVEEEVRRMQRAIEASREQLEALKFKLEEKVGREHSFILDVHLLMLEDRNLIADIINLIRQFRANAEWAVRRATDRIREAYESLDDEYFRERGTDIENVVERILLNLSGDKPFSWEQLPHDLIIVSHSFNPSSFASMDLQKVRGLALEAGGRTSHTAIITRSLRIPAVMQIRNSLSAITSEDLLLINGDEGELVVNPSPERLESLRARLHEFSVGTEPASQSGAGNRLKDGFPVNIMANIELAHEAAAARRSGAEGIGLFRSELLFGRPHESPSMDEQRGIYASLAREMHPYPVTIRTLDAGDYRVLGEDEAISRTNPSMGLRGIRLSLIARERLFDPQIEAILRASSQGNVEIVLPMVSTVEEVWEAKKAIAQIRARLIADSVPVAASVPVGAMIEVPAAVLSLESIAGEVDFLSVGTNDLIQYMLAVDRANPRVAHLFQPLHPSVLQCLNRIAVISSGLQKPVRICGEMSSNPFFAVLLIGMGFRQLSMNTLSMAAIRQVLGELNMDDCREIARCALKFVTARETGEYLIEQVSRFARFDLAPHAREVRSPVTALP